jgi:BMFP domain-containing protein YqiC
MPAILINLGKTKREIAMFKDKFFEELSAKWAEVLAKSPVKDIEKNLKAMMMSVFDKLDLVTREEFDVQQEVLLHTREKLTALETRMAELERLSQMQPSIQDEL